MASRKPQAPGAAAAPDLALATAVYLRLGCLFLDFKGRPAACAMYSAFKLGNRFTRGALVGLFFGLTAHTRPACALPIIASLIGFQVAFTLVAAALRPFVSAFLNFLEVACGAVDLTLLVLVALVYLHNRDEVGEAPPALEGPPPAEAPPPDSYVQSLDTASQLLIVANIGLQMVGMAWLMAMQARVLLRVLWGPRRQPLLRRVWSGMVIAAASTSRRASGLRQQDAPAAPATIGEVPIPNYPAIGHVDTAT